MNVWPYSGFVEWAHLLQPTLVVWRFFVRPVRCTPYKIWPIVHSFDTVEILRTHCRLVQIVPLPARDKTSTFWMTFCAQI